jgi:hypothetical protein
MLPLGYFIIEAHQGFQKGANTMVEMTRQAIAKVASILETKHKLKLPRSLSLQFDNSGENKVPFYSKYHPYYKQIINGILFF